MSQIPECLGSDCLLRVPEAEARTIRFLLGDFLRDLPGDTQTTREE